MSERKAVSPKVRFERFKKDSFQCQYCGRKTPEVILEIEHIVAVANGGTNDIENLTTACWDCNRGKGATPLDEIPGSIDLHQQTIELAEREMQLREYNAIKEQARLRKDKDLGLLREVWGRLFPRADNVYPNALASFLEKIAREDIIGAMQKTARRFGEKAEYESGGHPAGYLCKVLKGILQPQAPDGDSQLMFDDPVPPCDDDAWPADVVRVYDLWRRNIMEDRDTIIRSPGIYEAIVRALRFCIADPEHPDHGALGGLVRCLRGWHFTRQIIMENGGALPFMWISDLVGSEFNIELGWRAADAAIEHCRTHPVDEKKTA